MQEIFAFTHLSTIKPLPHPWSISGKTRDNFSYLERFPQAEGGVGTYYWNASENIEQPYWVSALYRKPCKVHKASVHLFSFGSNVHGIWQQVFLGYFPASPAAEYGHVTNFQSMISKEKYVQAMF